MFNMNLVQLSNRAIGKIKFDAVTSEDHQADLDITENPIESGAMVADHSVIKPKQVTVVGVMVDHDHGALDIDIPFVGSVRGVSAFLDQFPLPCKVVAQTTQTIARANRLISQAKGFIAQGQKALNATRQLAPWLPDFNLGGLLGSSGGDSRVQKCYADLLTCQKSGETIEVQTGIQLYKNMLIQSIAVSQAQDGSANFTITLREIFIVETQKTRGSQSSSAGKQKSGRAANQSASKVQQGNTNPPEAKPASALSHLSNSQKSGQIDRLSKAKEVLK